MDSCILCKNKNISVHLRTDSSTYIHCFNCDLIFTNPADRLPPSEEKKRYDLHENDPEDARYREFLNQLFEPLHQRLEPNSTGLDFGAGPGPTLSIMFEEAGHTMEIFDPFYANNPSVLQKRYDFITSTETVEHFYHPKEEFETLWKMIKPGGILGIMTLLRPKDVGFKNWHYRKDDTHVALYSSKTFQWLSNKFEAELTIIGDRVILLEKHH